MHVIIDGVVFENTSQIGIWRLYYEIIRRTSSEVRYTLLINGKPLQPVPEGVDVRAATHRPTLNKSYIVRARRKIRNLFPFRLDDNAIWHSTYFTRDPRGGFRNIVTVHDLISERLFYVDSDLVTQSRHKKEAIENSRHLIAISNSTADDITRFFPIDRSKVAVMPLGHEHIARAQLGAQLSSSRDRYALFVGNRANYKNFLAVLEAMVHDEWPTQVKLQVVGSAFSTAELRLIDYLELGGRIVHRGRISDEHLSEIYRGSDCFLFPSLLEGFGIPILEAQVNQCVPVISDMPVFREVAGQGAIFFDPYSRTALCQAVKRALEPEVRDAVLRSADVNLTRYSWDKAAEVTLAAYAQIASNQ